MYIYIYDYICSHQPDFRSSCLRSTCWVSRWNPGPTKLLSTLENNANLWCVSTSNTSAKGLPHRRIAEVFELLHTNEWSNRLQLCWNFPTAPQQNGLINKMCSVSRKNSVNYPVVKIVWICLNIHENILFHFMVYHSTCPNNYICLHPQVQQHLDVFAKSNGLSGDSEPHCFISTGFWRTHDVFEGRLFERCPHMWWNIGIVVFVQGLQNLFEEHLDLLNETNMHAYDFYMFHEKRTSYRFRLLNEPVNNIGRLNILQSQFHVTKSLCNQNLVEWHMHRHRSVGKTRLGLQSPHI